LVGMNSNIVLTSYATFKELYRSNKYKDPYQILSEFIRYIIVSRSLRQFAIADIKAYLEEEFGFIAPQAVISTSTARISGLTFQNGQYRPDLRKIKRNQEFQDYQTKNKEQNQHLINELLEFTRTNYPDVRIEKGKLSQDLISFLLDESSDNGCSQIIGDFVLQNQDNKIIKSALESVREGSILYSGLSYHLDEFDMNSEELTLFLDTEILFDIAGLHGELNKTLADDFLTLVDAANKNGKRIYLQYFYEVKKDVDNVYGAAERIVEENQVTFDDAIKEIISGCSDATDVVEKKTKFYRNLHIDHGIRQDAKENYYTPEDDQFNLEADMPGMPVADDSYYEGMKFCSHINKLRKGYQTQNYLDCKYLCVSNTRRVVEVSRAICEQKKNPSSDERYCDYAVSLTRITNILWFLLNRGFGSKELPKNLDVVIKARLILSAYITQGVTEAFKEIKRKLDNKEITEEEAAGYTLALRRKHTLPEDISAASIKEDLDFSENAIGHFVEESAVNHHKINEQTTRILELENEVKELKSDLERSQDCVRDAHNEIEELKRWKEADEKAKQNEWIDKEKKHSKWKFAWAITWKVLIVVGVFVIAWLVCKLLNVDFTLWLGIIIGIISTVPSAITVFLHDRKKYQDANQKLESSKDQSASPPSP